MKLVVIYGPPAVGKLTVARELAKVTGYRIFHNHLTVDLITSIFEFGSPGSGTLVDRYRLELIGIAAKKNIKGLIFTFVYANTKEDDDFIKRLIRLSKHHRIKTRFVQLVSEKKELERRVKERSRNNFSKIKDKKTLRSVISRYDLFTPISFVRSLTIDNTKISAKGSAEIIKRKFRL